MTRREIRNEIFKLLFEHELVQHDIKKRIQDVIEEKHLLKQNEKEFLEKYVTEIVTNEEDIIKQIREKLKGWTYERLGTVEKVLLKIAFYEILDQEVGYQIVINEALELCELYGDGQMKKFLNGVLSDLVDKTKK